jgi:hypothetical protein
LIAMSRRLRFACALAVALFECATVRAADSASPVIRLGGFADAELHTTSEHEREGLDVTELDVFSSIQFSNAWSALAEGVALRDWHTRERGDRLDLDLERLYVEYSTSDALRVEVGQTQTGIIRWNEREHRSRILQTPIDVPAIARRPQEDGAWPLNFVGAFASGRAPGALGMTWGAGLGAGPGRRRESTPLSGDGRSPAALLSIAVAPDAAPGLELAAAAYAGNVHTTPGRIRERDVTLSASYLASGNELRAEWATMDHRVTGDRAPYRTTGYYILFSKRLGGRAAQVRPYVMLDRLDVARGEAYLHEATNENAWATGVRYDLTRHFSLKGEYRSQRALSGARENVFGFQFGVSF